MQRTLIAGNWKMNGTRSSVAHLLQLLVIRTAEVSHVEWVVFPPFVFLPQAAETLRDSLVTWGAQNLSHEQNGAFTGEVSAEMLLDFGCRYVIVGHSERRTLFHENDGVVALKFKKALLSNLHPILCVGESLQQRQAGETFKVIKNQLDAVFSGYNDDNLSYENAVIAYEPLWAIGTGKQATTDQAQEIHRMIRDYCAAVDKNLQNIRILYGGSVRPDNAEGFLSRKEIDGVLVGGASLQVDQFIEIGLCSRSY